MARELSLRIFVVGIEDHIFSIGINQVLIFSNDPCTITKTRFKQKSGWVRYFSVIQKYVLLLRFHIILIRLRFSKDHRQVKKVESTANQFKENEVIFIIEEFNQQKYFLHYIIQIIKFRFTFMVSQLVIPLLKVIPSHKIDFFGSDSLMFTCLPYYTLLILMIIGISLFQFTRNPYILLFIIYGLIPIIDEIISIDGRNPTRIEAKLMEKEHKYQIPLYLTIVVDWLILIYALRQYSSATINLMTFVQIIGFVIVISNLNAAQFSVSHELMHKGGWRRVIGTLHMIKTLNMHFTYEHVYGHHRKVATPEDPASAKKNENVYLFFLQSYFGAYKSVYSMECQKKKPLYQNVAVVSCISSFGFCFLINALYGKQALMLYLVQVFGAVFYLQVINFIEHYGLQRKKLSNGEYQKVTVKHSWNAPHRLSNYIFFKLQRHSDHHENALKPYQSLLTVDESPQLPHGYIVMTVMALFPPIFKRIMNPLVDTYKKEKKNLDQQKTVLFGKAVQETRIFIGQLALYTTLLMIGYATLIK